MGAEPVTTAQALTFAAFVVGLVGEERVDVVQWYPNDSEPTLSLSVTDTTHAQTVAQLLGLNPRRDFRPDEASEGWSSWSGKSGAVPVRLRAPLALGGLPARKPYGWTPDEADAPVPYALTGKAA